MNPFKSAENLLHDLLSHLRSWLVAFANPLLDSIEKNGGKVLADAAMAAVNAAETIPGGGEVKAAAAFASVVAVLTSEGIPVVTNAVKGAIEIAVANLKASAA